MSGEPVSYRDTVRDTDPASVRAITESTGFFYPDEIDTAVELVEERLEKGLKSGYHFVFAEAGGRAVGYSCFGPIACTKSSFDHYWLAVADDWRGKGLGTAAHPGNRARDCRPGRRTHLHRDLLPPPVRADPGLLHRPRVRERGGAAGLLRTAGLQGHLREGALALQFSVGGER